MTWAEVTPPADGLYRARARIYRGAWGLGLDSRFGARFARAPQGTAVHEARP